MRKNTVVVICHLVTREMVKVRGHVAEICLCLEDTEVSISGMYSVFREAVTHFASRMVYAQNVFI